MTKKEKGALMEIVSDIRGLASLENARFEMTDEADRAVKKSIRPYMTWFESAARYLEDLANADDEFSIEKAIDNIYRYCR